jgi:hypothetical protein
MIPRSAAPGIPRASVIDAPVAGTSSRRGMIAIVAMPNAIARKPIDLFMVVTPNVTV